MKELITKLVNMELELDDNADIFASVKDSLDEASENIRQAIDELGKVKTE